MKAAILTNTNVPLYVQHLSLPETLAHGQVLVEIKCTGICGAQIEEITGQKGNPAHLPHLLGHEGCGIVLGVGPYVRTVKPGDKVVLHWRKGDGCEAVPATYSQGRIKAGPITTFSKFAVVSENRVTTVPEDLPVELGALLGCALSTALATMENAANVQFGESVLILGCGGVGLSMILAAKLAHTFPILAVDQYASKKELAESFGAEFTTELDKDWRFDVVIETSGRAQFFPWIAPSGRAILIGQPLSPDIGKVPLNDLWHLFEGEGKTVKASQGGGFNPTQDIPRYVKLWRSGALSDYPKLISHRMPLDQINEGITLMRQGKTARVMLYP